MSDNVHGVGVNDVAESIEQDAIKAKTDLISITSSINLDTVGTNQTTFTNQLSGASSSGLKTLIEGNDTDISNINDKLDMSTSSNMKTAIDLNTAKVTFPGIGTTASTCLAGNTTTISATQASKITANENAINAIETKTDFITVTQNVDLDDMESTIVSNTSSAGVNSANITNILNNTISSTLKTAVDANSAKTGITATEQTKLSNITVSSAVNLNTMSTLITSNSTNKLNNSADDIFAGELKVFKASDDNHLSVVCDAPNEAVLSVGGNESVQGTALINFGQGITHSTRRGTFGGFLSYEGDSNTEVGANTRFLQDTIHMGFFTSGAYYPTFHFNNSSADRNVFFRDGVYVRDKVTTGNEYTMNGVIHCDETCRSVTGNLSGWKPTGTTSVSGSIRKVMLESLLDEGSGIALSEQGMCMWSADNGLYLVDEDSVTGTSYAGFYYHINQSGVVSTSDRNLKRNIRDLSFNRSFCDIINDINPVLFNWKPHYDITDESGNETERYKKHKNKWETENVGVIAQDLPAEVKQYLMSGDENDCGHDKPLGVDYVKLTMYLIGAVKELKKEIEILKQ